MTPREQLDGMMGDLRGEMEALRRENADLKARVEEMGDKVRSLFTQLFIDDECYVTEAFLEAAMSLKETLSLPTLGASERLRDKHYRECEEIARNVHAPVSIGRDKGRHHEAGAQHAAKHIARAREEGR